MAKQTINLGTTPTGVGGDTPRSAFTKANANFDEIYSSFLQRSDILGTVSQSNGVPTGAVIETGSTATGEYVRFANGTQICRFSWSGTIALNSALNGVYTSGWITWTYPIGFVGRPNVIITPRDDTATLGFCATGGNGGLENIRLAQVATSGSFARTANFVAIGRWY